jgi:hypothetical protein
MSAFGRKADIGLARHLRLLLTPSRLRGSHLRYQSEKTDFTEFRNGLLPSLTQRGFENGLAANIASGPLDEGWSVPMALIRES